MRAQRTAAAETVVQHAALAPNCCEQSAHGGEGAAGRARGGGGFGGVTVALDDAFGAERLAHLPRARLSAAVPSNGSNGQRAGSMGRGVAGGRAGGRGVPWRRLGRGEGRGVSD